MTSKVMESTGSLISSFGGLTGSKPQKSSGFDTIMKESEKRYSGSDEKMETNNDLEYTKDTEGTKDSRHRAEMEDSHQRTETKDISQDKPKMAEETDDATKTSKGDIKTSNQETDCSDSTKDNISELANGDGGKSDPLEIVQQQAEAGNIQIIGMVNVEAQTTDFETKLQNLTDSLKNKLEEILGMDDQQLEQGLKSMGLELMQLLQPETAKEFVAMMSGESNVAFALTSEDLSGKMEQLNQFFQNNDIQSILGLSKEELNKLVQEAIKNQQTDVSQSAGSVIETQIDVVKTAGEEQTEALLQNEVQPKNVEQDAPNQDDSMINGQKTINNPNMSDEPNNFQDTNGQANSSNQNGSQILKQQTDQITKETENKADGKTDNNTETAKAGNFEDSFGVDQITKALVSKLTTTNEGLVREVSQLREAQDIVRQVVEKIKVNVKADTTTMEVQLNPENLGKINLNITSKNGEMTAKFIVENQITKEALESQMIVLKEKLEAQGLKVNEVEVSLSNQDMAGTFKQDGQQEDGRNNSKRSSEKSEMKVSLKQVMEEIRQEQMDNESETEFEGTHVDLSA